jgi:hypothetical protein
MNPVEVTNGGGVMVYIRNLTLMAISLLMVALSSCAEKRHLIDLDPVAASCILDRFIELSDAYGAGTLLLIIEPEGEDYSVHYYRLQDRGCLFDYKFSARVSHEFMESHYKSEFIRLSQSIPPAVIVPKSWVDPQSPSR